MIVISLATPSVAASPAAQPKPEPSFPFSTEIEDFAEAEAAQAVPDATLFLGSSSIRLWNVRDSFPKLNVINRGFGGATTPDVLHYYERLRPREQPRSVIVYVGENDLSAGTPPAKVAADVLILLGRLRADFPKARILCLSLKPSPIRWTSYPKMQAVNALVASRARAIGFDYLDVGGLLLATDGLPDASLFRPDGLHMNSRGYALWNRLIIDWLDAGPPLGVPKPSGVAVANRP